MGNEHGTREGLIMIGGALVIALAVFLGTFAAGALIAESGQASVTAAR